MTSPRSLLIDASVWCAAADKDDPYNVDSERLVRSCAVVSLDLTLYEVANVAIRAWRSPQRAQSVLDLVIGAIAQPPIPVTETLVVAALAIAEEHSISVYDAAYAAAAEQLSCQLVSCDVRDLVGNGLAVLPDAATD